MTDRCRRCVILSQEEARLLSHSYIGTEHILLGLIQEGEGVGAHALKSMGIELENVRKHVEETIGRGRQQVTSGHIPFTPRARKVLELALREALQLGHNYIGTEHLLLALIREGEGVGAQTLVKLGADLNRARREVLQLLNPPRKKKDPEVTLAVDEPMTLEQFRELEGRKLGDVIAEGSMTLNEVHENLFGTPSGGDIQVKQSLSVRLLHLCQRLGHQISGMELDGYDFNTSDVDGLLEERLTIRWRPTT